MPMVVPWNTTWAAFDVDPCTHYGTLVGAMSDPKFWFNVDVFWIKGISQMRPRPFAPLILSTIATVMHGWPHQVRPFFGI